MYCRASDSDVGLGVATVGCLYGERLRSRVRPIGRIGDVEMHVVRVLTQFFGEQAAFAWLSIGRFGCTRLRSKVIGRRAAVEYSVLSVVLYSTAVWGSGVALDAVRLQSRPCG